LRLGADVRVEPLGSQQDANFLLTSATGETIGVLKVANPAFTRVELEAQDAAARLISERHPDIRTGQAIELTGLEPVVEVTDRAGMSFLARVLTYLPGGTLSGTRYLSPQKVSALGTLAGRTSRTLADFDHLGVDRVLQWDLQYADRIVELLAAHVTDKQRRARVRAECAGAWKPVVALADRLPTQVIHCDLTDDNVVCDARDGMPNGIIDFGDLTRSWAVGELAVTVSSVLRHEGGEAAATLPAIDAFHAERPLSGTEIDVLWPLVVLRGAVLVVSGSHQAVIDSGNAYATGALEDEWRIFDRACEVPTAVMTALIRHRLGIPAFRSAAATYSRVFAELEPASIESLDLSTESTALDGGVWLEPDCEDRLAAQRLGAAAAVMTGFGQPRLTKSVALANESPATIATGIDLWLSGPSPVVAPSDAVVTDRGTHRVALRVGTEMVSIEGDCLTIDPRLVSGHAVESRGVIATAGPGRVWIQLADAFAPPVPRFVRHEYAPGWLDLVRDPANLLGVGPAHRPPADAAELINRRDDSFAAVQEHYYRHPPRIERGWREYLVSTEGRSYLDMVNNVAVLGHGHPDLAAAAAGQWRKLNTNSRFNYASVVALSERLAALLPDPLDTVFLVNSGSEAVDLALRLAFAATGRHDVVAVAEAYHGWTYATDAISTSTADNPNALSTRPAWVHTVPSPNTYRGEKNVRYAAEAAGVIRDLVAQGHPPAAFVCEPFYGNAGGMALPDGYLHTVYQAIRAAGGIAIADEVQVGYGRLGRWFWGFEQQGVVPDAVTIAKAMGNGQPLGAVITTRAIADAFGTQGYFFSSAGGSPVSCVIGLTVLDVIERDGLQHNALEVGDHLITRLTRLADRHAIIGAVHGQGLYIGVELVRDRETREPAVEETAAICERMRELGVIVQPTGDRMCVLKVKPPMCIGIASADFFADTLDHVLRTGW
jgi:4-aminobutyrate aminotransferase-like enzyme/Ser/Thr protein kinase RdoA (MazF antagonist)